MVESSPFTTVQSLLGSTWLDLSFDAFSSAKAGPNSNSWSTNLVSQFPKHVCDGEL